MQNQTANFPINVYSIDADGDRTELFERKDMGFRNILLDVRPTSEDIEVHVGLAPEFSGTPSDVVAGERAWFMRDEPLTPEEAVRFVERNEDMIREVAAVINGEKDDPEEGIESAKQQLGIEWPDFESGFIFGDGETVLGSEIDPDILDDIEEGKTTVEDAAKNAVETAFSMADIVAYQGDVENCIRSELTERQMERDAA